MAIIMNSTQPKDTQMKVNFTKAALAIVASSLSVAASATVFTIDAKDNASHGGNLFNTGLVFTAGQVLNITANPNDLWNGGPLPRWSNADGMVANLYATGSDESGQPAGTLIGSNQGILADSQRGLAAPYGSLVGSINGNYFFAGTSFHSVAPASGTLYFFYWDVDASNNTGSINVNVSSVPEPTTQGLMLLGLIPAVVAVRRRAKSVAA